MAEQLLSQKYANYNYAPGIATYGVDGKTGQAGNDGNNIYFTDYNINENENLEELMQKIANNYLPIKGSITKINRSYKKNDIFFDRNGVIYKLIEDNIDKILQIDWEDYFAIVGKINITDGSDIFVFAPYTNRLILNSSYNGYDICSNVDINDASQYINTDAAVNIISSNIDENNNIEMVRMQSIDDIDIEDGKMAILYKTTENAFYVDSNKPIVINGDLKVNSSNNINNEYDNFSTVLTSNDPITYFKHICDKLRYNIVYDDQRNRYFVAIYSIEEEIETQKQTLQYIIDRNETIFGKLYTEFTNLGTNNIALLKLHKNFDTGIPYIYGYISNNIENVIKISLLYNTEIFLTYSGDEQFIAPNEESEEYSSIKLMRYNAFYYGFFKDKRVLIPDETCYYEYTGEKVWYPNENDENRQLCYVWIKYNNHIVEHNSNFGYKLLTNSLQLTLPFNSHSPEFVAYLTINGEMPGDYDNELDLDDDKHNNYPISYNISSQETPIDLDPINFELPKGYYGLCILRKTI